MYIVVVALQDGAWHHVRSYAPERASRADTVALWHKVSTVEDPRWTERYHAKEHEKLAFGGRIVIRMKDGTVLADELAVANAHPLEETPWKRPNYVGKFHEMTAGLINPVEGKRFLEAVEELPLLKPGTLDWLHVTMPRARSTRANPACSDDDETGGNIHVRDRHRSQTRKEGRGTRRRHCRQHRALHRRAHRQRPTLSRLRHP